MKPANVIGGRVKHLRIGIGVSEEELARRLKTNGSPLTQQDIVAIEAGTRRVIDTEVLAIADALYVDVDDLFIE